MTIHAARVDCCGNIDTGKYDITVDRNRHGTSFAEVRDQQGNFVERIYAGGREELPDGSKVRFRSDKRGEEITFTDKCGHTDKFNRPSEHDEWDRDHVRGGRSQGHDRHDCNDGDGGHVRGGRSHGHDRRDGSDWDRGHVRPERPRRPGGDDCNCNDGGSAFNVDERNNTVDTGRYLIKASGDKDGRLQVFDKRTSQWVEAWGDPHLATSDGDKANFNKTFTLNLPDGTKVTVNTTGGENSHLRDVTITKDGQAAVIRYDEDHNPRTEQLRGDEARSADCRTPDGGQLYTIDDDNLDDLTFGPGGPELKGDEGDIDDELTLAQRRQFSPYWGSCSTPDR